MLAEDALGGNGMVNVLLLHHVFTMSNHVAIELLSCDILIAVSIPKLNADRKTWTLQ